MSYNISKIKLEKFSLFSISSKEFGYGHYNRIVNLVSILRNNKTIVKHFSYRGGSKNKNQFLKKLKLEVQLNKKIILDITNKLFLDKDTILKIKKILLPVKKNIIFIIDEPTTKNLSLALNIKNIKTLIPFEIENSLKKKLSIINKKAIGFKYFIYSSKKIKKKKKIYDITLSFGGSDNYEGTFYVLKLLEQIKIKKNIIVVIGKYFKTRYKKKIFNCCKKNKFKIKSFSKNFNDILNKSRLLITNSGLTKYEGVVHGLPVIVFSDSKESQKIDKVFIKKTKQFHFSYLRIYQDDLIKLKSILDKQLKFKIVDKNMKKLYTNNIINFFKT